MSETPRAPEFEQPPSGITPAPLVLDGVTFTPDKHGRIERAERDGVYIGDVLLDLESYWFARKVGPDHKLSDWKHMRCVHEARAFIVSRRASWHTPANPASFPRRQSTPQGQAAIHSESSPLSDLSTGVA